MASNGNINFNTSDKIKGKMQYIAKFNNRKFYKDEYEIALENHIEKFEKENGVIPSNFYD